MGYDLINSKGFFRFNGFVWHRVLILAQYFGWKPMGTVMPEGNAKLLFGDWRSNEESVQEFIKSWEGGYNSNDFQLVVKEDALNLAHALMKAMEVLPDEVNDMEYFSKDGAIDYFSGKAWKNRLNEFIQFCKNGEFDIT